MKPLTLPCGITLSPRTVLSLAAAHIGHFHEKLELLAPGTHVDDCRYYLQIWTEIRTLTNAGRRLCTEHVQELHDAVTSRGYDSHLESDELLMVLAFSTTQSGRRAS